MTIKESLRYCLINDWTRVEVIMQLSVDLHSHSGYAGGVGNIQLSDICQTMAYKGIDIFATGDCLYPQRTNELKQELAYGRDQLYALKQNDRALFLLQTEVIFSVALDQYKHKIVAHHIILFPDFESIHQMQKLMTQWNQKNTIGRPFIVCKTQKELEDRLFQIQHIHPLIEIIPAHVLTPDGIMGSKNKLSSIKEFYGAFIGHIHAIETGLSADPQMLSELDELNRLTMISSSDCHSHALNRVGREFTVIETESVSYESIIQSIRQHKVVYTAEFNPKEGRYYLSGHRANKAGHEEDFYIIDRDYVEKCPVCGKKLTQGVIDRCKEIQKSKAEHIQKFMHLIPLIDVIAYALNIKNINSPKVMNAYMAIVRTFQTEINLWQNSNQDIYSALQGKIDENIIKYIVAVKKQDFSYDPPGFDGQYGCLKINN